MAKYLKGFGYTEINSLERGDRITIKDRIVSVFYVSRKPSSGVGMGENPPTATVVFSDGTVVTSDPWSPKDKQALIIHGKFKE